MTPYHTLKKQIETGTTNLKRSDQSQAKFKNEYCSQEFETALRLILSMFKYAIIENRYGYDLDPSIEHYCIFTISPKTEQEIKTILDFCLVDPQYVLCQNQPQNQSCKIPHWHIFFEVSKMKMDYKSVEEVLAYIPKELEPEVVPEPFKAKKTAEADYRRMSKSIQTFKSNN